ncbi:hypothetical protein L3X38_005689 [Prunus dulcis]|uniref:Uncharacterized protein n=1 Tax=Prunus dulcis TaxID=3755 RepID=A0AAD4ZRH9_PRUDU|nr:hypothetical protein L3X38_005689 [Prunus dulcis]
MEKEVSGALVSVIAVKIVKVGDKGRAAEEGRPRLAYVLALHQSLWFLTEVLTLLWLEENSGVRSRSQKMEMGRVPAKVTLTLKTPPAAFHGPTPSGSVGTVVHNANVASSIASTRPILGFTGFTLPAGFFTCAGPTSEVVPDPFDDAP